MTNSMDNRGVTDSVSNHPKPMTFHIPWSDSQRAHFHRDLTPDHSNLESPETNINVGSQP